MMKQIIVCLSLLLLIAPSSRTLPRITALHEGVQQISTGINRGAQEVRLALPEFQGKANDPNAARFIALFNQVLWDDLDYSGNITLVSRSFYPSGKFMSPTDIKVEDWTKPGSNAQYLAFGSADIRNGGLYLEARLWDLGVVQNRELIASGINSGALTDDAVRNVAHIFADMVVNSLFGGKMGIAQTKIAYVATTGTGKEIFTMDYDGNNAGAVTSNRSISVFPNWAPTGDRLAYATVKQGRWGLEVLSVLDRRVTSFPPITGTVETPAWSPDGSKIAYAASADKGGSMAIHVADWNGRNARRLTVTNKFIDISPSWNPKTGNQIAFVSDRSGTQQLYIMDAEGTNPQRIIDEGGDAENPSWSPDGQNIVFAWKKPGSRFDIYLHDLATGRNSQLTSNAGDNERPSWAPDGRHIVFASNKTGRSQIYTMLANGQKLRQLTKTGSNEGPAWSSFLGK